MNHQQRPNTLISTSIEINDFVSINVYVNNNTFH